MLFGGIDPSLTGSGFVILDEFCKIVDKIKLSTPTVGVERLYHLELKLLEFLDKYPQIKLICIEGAAYRETGRIFHIGQWSGIHQLTLYKRGIPFFEVAPLQLKKYVSGVGKNQGKETIMLDVFKNFGEEIRDNDIADAYVLSKVAHDYFFMYSLNKRVELKKYQVEVLKKLNSSELEKLSKSLL